MRREQGENGTSHRLRMAVSLPLPLPLPLPFPLPIEKQSWPNQPKLDGKGFCVTTVLYAYRCTLIIPDDPQAVNEKLPSSTNR